MTRDSIWRCFMFRRQPNDWFRLTPKTYVLLVLERNRLRHSERRYARRHPEVSE